MRRHLFLAALCAILSVPSAVRAQVRADPPAPAPKEDGGAWRVAPPVLYIRHAIPPRQPDGTPDPGESGLLTENEKWTRENIDHLYGWLEALADGAWTELDRAAAERALEDMRAEFTALA
ncbi:MAG: hypothetical protein FD126_3162, partial [Elusimicrobia bacterium]